MPQDYYFHLSMKEEKKKERKILNISGDKLLLKFLVPGIKCLVCGFFFLIIQIILGSRSQFITNVNFIPLYSTKKASECSLRAIIVSQARDYVAVTICTAVCVNGDSWSCAPSSLHSHTRQPWLVLTKEPHRKPVSNTLVQSRWFWKKLSRLSKHMWNYKSWI